MAHPVPPALITSVFLCFSYLVLTQKERCLQEPRFLYSYADCPEGEYELVFQDEFDGDSLDLEVWELVVWSQGSLIDDQHHNYYSLDNVEISGGTLKIIARKENVVRKSVYWLPEDEILDDGLPNLRSYRYTSSSLWTKQFFFYGKYEARCRLPDGEGFWPAFWVYSDPWNEIDFFDNYRNTNDFIAGVGHDFDGDDKSEGCPEIIPNYTDMTQWHIYTCIYQYDKIQWLVDGAPVRTFHRYLTVEGQPIDCGDHIDYGTYLLQKAYPRDSMHIIISIGIQAGKNAPDASTPFPGIFEVDYVRFYTLTDSNNEELYPFPNPTDGFFSIESEYPIEKISLYDVFGKIIWTKEKLPSGINYFDIGPIQNGIFYLGIIYKGGFKSYKIIKS